MDNIPQKLNKASKVAFGVLLVLFGGMVWFGVKQSPSDRLGLQSEALGAVGGYNWFIQSSFDGYQTKYDPSKISDGANPNGQNTSINEGDRISVRNLGYESILDNTGWVSPTSTTIFNLTNLWNSPYNATSSDNNYATSSVPYDAEVGYEQIFTGFDFNIPSNANITGIEVSIEGKATADWGGLTPNAYPLEVSLSDITDQNDEEFINLPNEENIAVLGDPNYMWGGEWTINDLEDHSSFYLILSNTEPDYNENILYIDNIMVKVYYVIPSPITSLHTFRRRDGENIIMKSFSTYLEYYDEIESNWEVLKSDYTANQKFGFSDNNINTDLNSYTYFGNGVDNFARWTGAHTNFQENKAPTSTATILFVNDTSSFSSAGAIIYCGTEIAYTEKTDTTFTVASAHACYNEAGVAQTIEEFSEKPKGNIYLYATNRLFISGVASSTQAVFFSGYASSTDFTVQTNIASSTDASAGIFNLGEGGGGVVGMALDEKTIDVFKRSIVYAITLDDTTYSLNPLKTFDGKSQTFGAVNSNSVFAGGNGLFFLTPDNRILNLARVEGYDYPQATAISDIIKPTVDSMQFASSTGIVFRDNAYFSIKKDSESYFNDTVLNYNISIDKWDSPILWNVGEWTVYNSNAQGDGLDELYFGDSTSANVYKVINTPTDDIYSVTANWRSKQYDFGLPQSLKEMDNLFFEGLIAPDTNLTISLLLDDNGWTQSFATTLAGTESDYIFASDNYNVFGLSVFGYERFGSNEDQTGKKKFRIYLNKSFRVDPFYSAQIEFASDGENQNWEILRYGFSVRESTQPIKTKLMRAFQ